MNSDADEFWDNVAGKLRKVNGLCPLSQSEAEAAFDDAPEVPLSEDEIEKMVDAVTSGELASWDPVLDEEAQGDEVFDDVDAQVLQLFRNEGEDDPAADQAEADLENELLNQHDPEENQDGLAGGTAPPGGGR